MSHSFLAYIDESGDDGLAKFREPGVRGGASNWLVLSACVFRATHKLDAVAWRDEINSKMPQRKSRTLHFTQLDHGQRVVAAQVLGEKPVRLTNVIVSKRDISPGTFKDRNQLYLYMARYLIERLSWLCRDLRPKVPEGDGRCAITFSRRGGMSYDDFREYLILLKSKNIGEHTIHWPVIDIAAVDAQDHSRSAALQLADIAAASVAAAIEMNIYGNCEARYAELLRKCTYRRKENFLSYGMKFLPGHESCSMNEEQKRFAAMYE